MTETAHSIRKKTTRAIFWTTLELSGSLVVQFVLGIILARLLSPAEFGVIGMINIFLALSLLFINAGLGQALIYKKDATAADADTLFYFNIVIGAAMSGLLILCAGWIADFYQTPQLKPICWVLALDPFFNALGFTQFTLLKKTLNFRPLTNVTLIAVTLSGIIGVITAWYGWGAWALVFQNLSNNFFRTALLWRYGGWRPGLNFRWASLKELGRYGSKVLLAGITDVIFKNLYSVIIGKLYSPAMLGFYNRAYNLEQLPGRFIQNVISRVSFSSFSSLNTNLGELKLHYRETERLFLAITLPMMTILAISARPLVIFLLTDKWLPSVPLLQVLCVSAPLYLQQILEGNLLKSLGFVGTCLVLDTGKKVLLVALIWIFFNHGVVMLIWFDVLTSLLLFLAMRAFTMRALRYRLLEQLSDAACYVLLSALVAGCCLIILFWHGDAGNFLQLALMGSVSATLYLGGAVLLRDTLILAVIRNGMVYLRDRKKSGRMAT